MANALTTRHRNWAHRWKDWLLEQLGGQCAKCGSTERLEVDHQDGRDWELTEFSQAGRVRKYIEEYRRGVRLRALCKSCNSGYHPRG